MNKTFHYFYFWMLKFLMVCSILLFLAGIVLLVSRYQFLRDAIRSKAKIVRQYTTSDGSYSPVYTFEASNGKEYEITSSHGYNTPIGKKGDLIKILYDPSNPENSEEDNFRNLWAVPTFMALGGLSNFLFYGGLFYFSKKRLKRKAMINA